ncbi:hypothetical protein [Nocardia transvalensis]|uniref:hypothetical protein n=1 Tax=Nocardia transvalensis TaxID=37333 RepID=UPI001894753C|nr:hypothetical protein [Nocardia transvalensis]MBF6334154.1 hypothetical protein [Nocardia transvalensis]
MHVLTVVEIDNELALRGREIDAITATLLELDKHPGLTLLRGYPPAGVTAGRWRPVRQLLDLMWEDFGRLQSILEQARAIRARRQKPTDADRAELTRLLRDRPHELSRVPIPLAERTLTGPQERVLFVGIADTLDRMRTSFPRIAEFLDAVDAINTRVLSGLAPVQAQLDQFGVTTAGLRAIADAVAELLSRSATDPLALTPAEIDTRIADLTDRIRRESDNLAELHTLLADWPTAIAETRVRLTHLRTIRERAERARAEAERKILTAPLPVHPDPGPTLRAGLESLAAHPPSVPDTKAAPEARAQAEPSVQQSVSMADAMALLDLRLRIAAAIEVATADEQLAQGLLDRWTELRGRLAAYQAKAARLGVGEDQEVLSSNRIATGLLSRRPCDLAAVTRAVADYQQAIAEKTGRRG